MLLTLSEKLLGCSTGIGLLLVTVVCLFLDPPKMVYKMCISFVLVTRFAQMWITSADLTVGCLHLKTCHKSRSCFKDLLVYLQGSEQPKHETWLDLAQMDSTQQPRILCTYELLPQLLHILLGRSSTLT